VTVEESEDPTDRQVEVEREMTMSGFGVETKVIEPSGGEENMIGGAFFLLCIRALGRKSDRALGLARVSIVLVVGVNGFRVKD
jgi:hypothetical protein